MTGAVAHSCCSREPIVRTSKNTEQAKQSADVGHLHAELTRSNDTRCRGHSWGELSWPTVGPNIGQTTRPKTWPKTWPTTWPILCMNENAISKRSKNRQNKLQRNRQRKIAERQNDSQTLRRANRQTSRQKVGRHIERKFGRQIGRAIGRGCTWLARAFWQANNRTCSFWWSNSRDGPSQ